MQDNLWDRYWTDGEGKDYWRAPAPEVLAFMLALSPDEHPHVLDLGCGLGRHAVAFAQSGFSVTALDSAAAAISQLDSFAREAGLSIDSQVGDLFETTFSGKLFDVVLSYNVLYHGGKAPFERSLRNVAQLLRAGGFFFFTCPSRRDGKYGVGTEIAPHTYASPNSVTPGDVHYFADERDLAEMLTGFRILELRAVEGYWNNRGRQQFSSNWHVRAERI